MAIPSLITDLSTNTASNSPLGSDLVGSPATVDDFFRSVEAILRAESLLKSWEVRGNVPTYVSGTVFTTPADQTAFYIAGRRLHAFGSANIYGSVVSASYNGAITTVTIVGDGGATLDASLSSVHLGVDPLSVQVLFVGGSSYYPITGGELRGNMTLSNHDIALYKNIVAFQEYDWGNSGAAKTISWTPAQNSKITINAATTLFIKPPPGIGHYQLRMIQDGTGGWTVAIGNVGGGSWLNNTAQPAFNTAANGQTIITFWWTGTGWIGGVQKVGTT
jgi:hypothetical protein